MQGTVQGTVQGTAPRQVNAPRQAKEQDHGQAAMLPLVLHSDDVDFGAIVSSPRSICSICGILWYLGICGRLIPCASRAVMLGMLLARMVVRQAAW